MNQALTRRVALLLSVVIGLALLAGTLQPAAGAPQGGTGVCLICGERGGADFVANVLAFVPFGLVLRGWLRSSGRATLVVLAFTLLIELLQWRVIPGRDASLGDVVANAIGGGVGALVAGNWRGLTTPNYRQARTWIVTWCIACTVGLAAVCWMLMPSPVIYRFWSHWAPVQRGHQPFRGVVQSISLFDTLIPDGERIEPSSMPAAYESGILDLQVSIGPPYPAGAPAEVFRLANPLSQRANIAIQNRDILFQPPLNAARWRLWSPSVRFPGALPEEAVGAVLHVQSGRGEVLLSVSNGAPPHAWQRATLGAGDSWKLVVSDAAVPRLLHPVLAALWFVMVFSPLGFWSAALNRVLPGVLSTGAIAAVAFLIGPFLARIPAAPLLHWMVALGCALLGWVAGRTLGTRRSSMVG